MIRHWISSLTTRDGRDIVSSGILDRSDAAPRHSAPFVARIVSLRCQVQCGSVPYKTRVRCRLLLCINHGSGLYSECLEAGVSLFLGSSLSMRGTRSDRVMMPAVGYVGCFPVVVGYKARKPTSRPSYSECKARVALHCIYRW
eukprot:scaffold236789_cov52-Attheya_sp.AAC.1